MAIIPLPFKLKKDKILLALAAPDNDYTDASPKGSVDKGIRDLIDEMNKIDGIVTTSSCAGRMSIFLEGSKYNDGEMKGGQLADQVSQAAVPGGKGRGGRWLFVSHDPMDRNDFSTIEALGPVFEFSDQKPISTDLNPRKTRFAKFQFEPMILHVMTASLWHAQPVLSAAISAGFRESGVQSLKNLEDGNAFPMVAIRSSGLAFGSLIGFVDEVNDGKLRSLVNKDYMDVLFSIANDRFQANAERIDRFRNNLLQNDTKLLQPWEDRKTRKERKKAEGVKRQLKWHEDVTKRFSNGVQPSENPRDDQFMDGSVLEM